MALRLARAEHLRDYKMQMTLDDGRNGVIDLEAELWGEVFEPLKDPDAFQRFASTPRARHHRVSYRCRHGAGVPLRTHGVSRRQSRARTGTTGERHHDVPLGGDRDKPRPKSRAD